MSQGRFGLDVRRQFFMQRVVRQWHRLPKEAVDAHPIPAGIRGQAGCGSGQPGLLVGDLHTAGVGADECCAPLQPSAGVL